MSNNNTKQELYDRLPYYYDGENIENLLSVIASLFNNVNNELEKIRIAHHLSEASNQSLDLVAKNIGVSRNNISFIDTDTPSESDSMLRNRLKWNIQVQESNGQRGEIKRLFAEGLQMYRTRTNLGGEVWDPKLQVVDWDASPPPKWNILENDQEDVRVVQAKDIIIFENKDSNTCQEAPDGQHGKFGSLNAYYEINIPWKALPWDSGENGLIWHSQDDWNQTEPPVDETNGWNEGLYNAEDKALRVEPLQKIRDKLKPAGVQAALYGSGGFMWHSQDDWDQTEPPVDKQHGWGHGRWDGDLEEAAWAADNLDGFWAYST